MKTILFTITSVFFIVTSLFANTIDYTYLKIQFENGSEINYPPKTRFVAEDENGNAVLSPKGLEEQEIYKVEKPITLYVFTSWNDEPDVYKMKTGQLVLGKSEKTFTNIPHTKKGKKANDHYGRPTDRGTVNEYGGWTGNSNGMTITSSRFFDYDEETGYDASIEFSDGTIFYYRKGKAKAWKDGNKLTIKGKYLIETTRGIIKLSYKPETKKIYWVFDKSE